MDPAPRYEALAYRPAGKLRGRVALITGGDSGIGRSVALLFAREGADVGIVSLPEEAPDAQRTRALIEAEGRRALVLHGDVSDASFCASAVARTLETLGALHILVNNAAIQKHRADLASLSAHEWRRTFEVNIHGYFYMVQAALPHLARGAVILNTGSITGLEGSKDLLDYASTKGAIHAFTKSLAQAVLDHGIRVNCVAPGPVWTPLNPAERAPDDVKDFGADVPMGRPAQPEEIAPTYVFLASNADSSYITGEVITLLGGNTRAG
jgi:NAD(P)-dependent dehydrogenase (short-subunit alcohol dehydrogenase family)